MIGLDSFGNMDINATQEIWNFVSKYDINGLIDCFNSSISNHNNYQPTIINQIDILGRKSLINDGVQIHLFDDGNVKKIFNLK